MNYQNHEVNDQRYLEVLSSHPPLQNSEDCLQLLVDVYYQGAEGLFIPTTLLPPAFFDLSTGVAGEFLQKCSNYRMRLAVIGDFGSLKKGSFKDFVTESNQKNQILFVKSCEEAKQRWQGQD